MSESNPVLVLVAGPEVDLSPLTKHLWANRIAHRVVEVKGQQHLILGGTEDVPQVKIWVEQWRNGELKQPDKGRRANPLAALILLLVQSPLTLLFLLLLVGVFGWMLVSNQWQALVEIGVDHWPEQRNSVGLYFGLMSETVNPWTLWLPSLLHFSVLHLLMNAVWLWVLGRAIEVTEGSWKLAAIILLTGLIGNAVQWWVSGPGFGGASGITMGLLGWVGWRQFQQGIHYPVPKMLLPVMVGFLLLQVTTDTVIPGLTNMAHGAQIGGLVAGGLMAMLWRYRRVPLRMPADSDSPVPPHSSAQHRTQTGRSDNQENTSRDEGSSAEPDRQSDKHDD